MFNLFNNQHETKKQKSKQLWGRDFSIVENGLDEEQVVSFLNELLKQHKASSAESSRETATTDGEQISPSINLKTQREAEEEAARIVAEANKEAEEIKRRAETTAAKGTETGQNGLMLLLKAWQEIEGEIGDIKDEYEKVYSRLFSSLRNLISTGQNIEKELNDKQSGLLQSKDSQPAEYEAELPGIPREAISPVKTTSLTENSLIPDKVIEEKLEESVQSTDTVAVPEPVEADIGELLGPRLPKEMPEMAETEPDLPEEDGKTVYTDEVELAIAAPVDLNMVSKLYDSLQTIPELRILYTSGTANRGIIMTVVLERPVNLLRAISSKIPEVEAKAASVGKGSVLTGKANALLGKEKKRVRRINLVFNEVNDSNRG